MMSVTCYCAAKFLPMYEFMSVSTVRGHTMYVSSKYTEHLQHLRRRQACRTEVQPNGKKSGKSAGNVGSSN